MKHLLFTLIFAFFTLIFVQAQEIQELPIDPKIRMGKLENGLTYYLRHNELPKERADFYIAQKVGAVLENDDQNGLAHFLEHMAFNGSTHFPGNRVISYLESIGVKFGYNLNAFTSYDRTVYNISNVPVLTPGAIDSCLLVLHDWSGSLTLDEKEIEKERGVIREEMRIYGGADWRMSEKLLPQVMPGSRYAERNVIGTEEVIMNFKPETLRDFYKKWYRPDLQAIIIVGDVDINEMENKIKAVFADIPAPVNPAERVYFPVEDNVETLVGIATDKEATSTSVMVSFKHDPVPRELRGTIAGFLNDYFNSIIAIIMNERIQELLQQANPPFVGAGVGNSSFMGAATKDALTGVAYIKDNNVEMGLKTITREIERLNRYGFTASEYERAKANLISRYEAIFNEREKTQNRNYSLEYMQHFTVGSYIPGIEMEYNMITSIAPQIPVTEINEYVQELIGDTNIAISFMAPEKEEITLPSKENLLTWFNEAKNEDIQPIEETDNNEPLMSELPQGGTIVNEAQDPLFETVNYTLSNGVKVVIKPTQWKDDEILVTAFSPGGSSLFPETQMSNIKLYNNLSAIGGLANFSQTELNKILAGKIASASPYISQRYEGISGSSSVKDFETMLQLIYLNFTAPRSDEEAYQSFMGRYKSQLEQQEANPEIAFADTFLYKANVNKERARRLRTEDLKEVNYDTIMQWRKNRYADASDFTFVFTGNIDPETNKSLIAQYLGTLPSLNRNEKPVDIVADLTPGVNKTHFEQKMENVKAVLGNLYWTTLDENMKNKVSIDMLQQILNIVFMEKIREDEGGTYSIYANSSISDYPKGLTPLQIYFETQPGKEIYLNTKVHDEFLNIANNGPRPEDFNKVKEYMLKKQKEQEEENRYWNSIVSEYYRTGYDGYSNYVKTIHEMTPEDIQKIAKTFFDSNNLIEVIMTGIK
ncbi:MAG: insulinase family protein [Bacteroidales bacterium]|nr:insulinase family protein [Bacteroidales bacterium]